MQKLEPGRECKGLVPIWPVGLQAPPCRTMWCTSTRSPTHYQNWCLSTKYSDWPPSSCDLHVWDPVFPVLNDRLRDRVCGHEALPLHGQHCSPAEGSVLHPPGQRQSQVGELTKKFPHPYLSIISHPPPADKLLDLSSCPVTHSYAKGWQLGTDPCPRWTPKAIVAP